MSSKENPVETRRQVELAERLIALGMRRPNVADLTGLSTWKIGPIIDSIPGAESKSGRMCSTHDWYLGAKNNIAASVFYSRYEALKRVQPSMAWRIVLAHEHYLDVCKRAGVEAVMTADRSYWLIRMVENIRDLRFLKCRKCGGYHIAEAATITTSFICQSCRGVFLPRVNVLAAPDGYLSLPKG